MIINNHQIEGLILALLFKMKWLNISLLIFICGCNNSNSNSTIEFTEIETNFNKLTVSELGIDVINKIAIDSSGNVIIVNSLDWSLNLIDEKNNLLDTFGRIGNGPGEFSLINSVSVDKKTNELLVFDTRSKRVTICKIDEEKFKLTDTFTLPNYENLSMADIMRFKDGYIGVFVSFSEYVTSINNKETPINNFYFHYLDKNFEIGDRFLEVSGHELIKNNTDYIDNPFGRRTYWYWTEPILYYSSSDSLTFSRLDLEKQITQVFSYDSLSKTKIDKELIAYLLKEKESLFRFIPKLNDYLESKSEIESYFYTFITDKKFIYIGLNNYSNDEGSILQYNTETNRMKLISIPANFYLQDVFKNKLFGILKDSNEDFLLILNMENNYS